MTKPLTVRGTIERERDDATGRYFLRAGPDRYEVEAHEPDMERLYLASCTGAPVTAIVVGGRSWRGSTIFEVAQVRAP